MIGSILELIKSIPAIIGAMLELKRMWDQYLNLEQKKEAMQKFSEAIKNARVAKDTTKLTDLVNGIITNQSNSNNK